MLHQHTPPAVTPGIEPPQGLLRDLEHFPTHRWRCVHLLNPFRRRCTPPPRRDEGRHHIRGPQVAPMCARALGEADQSLPIRPQPLTRFRGPRAVTPVKWCPPLLARGRRVGIRHGAQSGPSLRLVLLWYGLQHIGDPMGPAAWLGCRWLLLAQGRPDAQMPIGYTSRVARRFADGVCIFKW